MVSCVNQRLQPGSKDLGIFFGYIYGKGGIFISSQTSNDVGGSEGLFEYGCCFNERFISFLVTQVYR